MTIHARSFGAVLVGMLLACGDDGDSTSGPGSTSDVGSTGSASMSGTMSGSGSTTMDEPTTTTDAESSSSGDPAGSGSGSSGEPGSSDGSGSSGGGLSFETDVWPLLEMERARPLSGDISSCNGCHATGAGGLTTPDVGGAYTNLMNEDSSSALCAGTAYVVPGDPDSSCFVLFYEMRLRDSLGWVDQAETDIVRAWVESGAAP